MTHRDRARTPRVKHYDNSWPLGPASWGALLSPSADVLAERCFGELERLRSSSSPSEDERAHYRRHRRRRSALLAEAH